MIAGAKMAEWLALDPGQTTGWATYNFGKEKWAGGEIFLPISEPWDPEEVRRLEQLISGADVVIYESWRLFAGKAGALTGDAMIGPQVVGVIRAALSIVGKTAVVQAPNMKSLAPDSILKKLGVWSTSPHTRDAHRHLIVRMRNEKVPFVIDTIRKMMDV